MGSKRKYVDGVSVPASANIQPKRYVDGVPVSASSPLQPRAYKDGVSISRMAGDDFYSQSQPQGLDTTPENYADTQARVRREREEFLKGYQSSAKRKTDCPPGCSPS